MRHHLVVFLGVTILALILVSVGAVIASRTLARGVALKDAERTTARLADRVIAPLLPAAFRSGSLQRADLDHAIENRLADGYLTQVTIWDSTGRVLYDVDPGQIGEVLTLPAEAQAAMRDDMISSGVTRQQEVVGGTIRGAQGFVEVFVPLKVTNAPRLAFEAYYDYARVQDFADLLLGDLIPLVLVPLIFLQLIHIPIAASLAARVRRQDAERFDLLELSLSASERERVRIAADLHDGPIQDLAGIGYAFETWAAVLPEPRPPIVRQLEKSVHHAVDSLRRLMIDLYPPDLDSSQLPRTIFDLAEPLRDKGLEVSVTVAQLPGLAPDTVTALYRVARESLANIAQHARAGRVTVNLGVRGNGAAGPGSGVYLRISDDGIGLGEGSLDRRAQGHLGLRLLRDRVEALGGSMNFTAAPGGGTVVMAILPNDRVDALEPHRQRGEHGDQRGIGRPISGQA